jgi:hypothetical protein
MVKNNIKSLLIHVMISIISVILFIAFNSSTAKWVSEEAARKHHYYMMFVAIAFLVVSIFLYNLLGRILLINKGSIYKNLVATGLTAIIGTFLWIIAFSMDLTGPSNYLLNSELWQFYSAYNGYCLFFLNESQNNNQYIYLLFTFIPTLAMGSGMLKNQRKNI